MAVSLLAISLELLLLGLSVANKYQLDWEIFYRQIKQESGWDQGKVSSAGAIGLGQIVPKWHPEAKVWDAASNLEYAAMLDRKWLDKYQSWSLALAMYNAGEQTVLEYRGVPRFEETQRYMRVVLGEDWEWRYGSRVSYSQPVSRGGMRGLE